MRFFEMLNEEKNNDYDSLFQKMRSYREYFIEKLNKKINENYSDIYYSKLENLKLKKFTEIITNTLNDTLMILIDKEFQDNLSSEHTFYGFNVLIGNENIKSRIEYTIDNEKYYHNILIEIPPRNLKNMINSKMSQINVWNTIISSLNNTILGVFNMENFDVNEVSDDDVLNISDEEYLDYLMNTKNVKNWAKWSAYQFFKNNDNLTAEDIIEEFVRNPYNNKKIYVPYIVKKYYENFYLTDDEYLNDVWYSFKNYVIENLRKNNYRW